VEMAGLVAAESDLEPAAAPLAGPGFAGEIQVERVVLLPPPE